MTDPGLGPAGIDALLARTRQSLAALRTGGDADLDEAVEIRGQGEAADGLVRATVAPGSRVEAIQLDPRVMRMSSEALAEEIARAVNAAFTNLREQAAETGAAMGVPDHAALAGQLRDLQDESVRRMAVFGAAMNEVVARLGQSSGGRHG
jgi:DNA-binding protein YbaB